MASLLLGAGCSEAETPPDDVKIVREEQIGTSFAVQPQVITRAPNGDYVVAGAATPHARLWAMRLDPSGRAQWQYASSPVAPVAGTQGFLGAAVLPDNSTVLCSELVLHPPKQVGWVVHLDRNGNELSATSIEPRNVQPSDFIRLKRCLRWGEGVALLGSVIRDNKAIGWLVKLDSAGRFMWEKLGPEGLIDSVETSDHELLLASSNGFVTYLQRVSGEGVVVTQGKVSGEAHFVRPVAEANEVKVMSIDPDGETRLWTLDRDFRPVHHFTVGEHAPVKVAYELSDKSIVVFGGVSARGAITAGIERIYLRGAVRDLVVQPPFSWSWFNDAVYTGEGSTFLTVRAGATSVLAWVHVGK